MSTASESANEGPGSGVASILIVDDEEPIVRLLSIVLGGKYTCMTAGTALEALLLLRLQKVDLVLADVGLPGMSGLELMEEVKRLSPQTPVVMLSGHIDERWVAKAEMKGAAGFIRKPFQFGDVLTTVEWALGQASETVTKSA